MKFGKMILGLLAPIGLCAFAAVATEMSGSATGRWKQVDPSKSIVEGLLIDSIAGRSFAFNARLQGRDTGTVVGTIDDLPQGLDYEDYKFVGTYARSKFGRVYVEGKILSDSTGMAVGHMQGALDPSRFRSAMGHFHGRWEIR